MATKVYCDQEMPDGGDHPAELVITVWNKDPKQQSTINSGARKDSCMNHVGEIVSSMRMHTKHDNFHNLTITKIGVK